MDKEIHVKFLLLCKRNYYEKISPSDPLDRKKPEYLELLDIAMQYFNNGKYEEFAGLLLQDKYSIPLWAAHFLVEYGKPNNKLLIRALNTILEWSGHPIDQKIATLESEWLNTTEITIKTQ